jgi:hypothetical protein
MAVTVVFFFFMGKRKQIGKAWVKRSYWTYLISKRMRCNGKAIIELRMQMKAHLRVRPKRLTHGTNVLTFFMSKNRTLVHEF